MRDSTRRRFLRTGGVVGIAGLTGCSQITGENDIKDTDGDGVINSEDYAPRDASVQDAEDVEEADSSESNGDDGKEDEPAEQDDTQTGNTLSLEMRADGELRLSESTTMEGVGTILPDIVVGTSYDGEGGCDTAAYEAEITDMSVTSGGSTYDIVDTVPFTEFRRDDTRKEVYLNPASGSDSWTWSFTVEPIGPEYTTPESYNCTAEMMIFMTEDGDWFSNPDENGPDNSIQYEISTSQGGWKRNGLGVPNASVGENESSLNPNGDNLEERDLYEEDVEWDITISRR